MNLQFTLEELPKAAQCIIAQFNKPSVLAFYGSMGVGKTTLIKAIIENLGAKDLGNSPTFGLVNEYEDHQGRVLAYHFDFYRIADEWEAMDIGVEDYLYSKAWVLIEWPEKIQNLLPIDHIAIHLRLIDKNTRLVEIMAS